MSMSSLGFDFDEDALLRDDPLLSQSSERNLVSAAQATAGGQSFYFDPSIIEMSFDMLKDKSPDDSVELMPLSILEDPSLRLEDLISVDISSDNGQPLTVAIVNNEQLTTRREWVDETFIQSDDDNGMPAVPNYIALPVPVMDDPLSSTNDGGMMIASSTPTFNPTAGDIVQLASVADAPSNSSSQEQSTSSLDPQSSLGKSRQPRRGVKKTFLHEAPNKDDPFVKRAALAKDYRDKKKLEAKQRENNLQKELDELKAEHSALRQKMDANAAVSREDTVKIVECVASAVKAAGGGDVIVSPRLANKQAVVNLTEFDIQKIVADASLSRPGKRFKLIFDLDAKGNLIADKID